MMRRLLIVFLALIQYASICFAQRIDAHRGVLSEGYNFWFFTPADSVTEGTIVADSIQQCDSLGRVIKPLIVYLHGRDHCGSDMLKVLRQGSPLDALQRGLKIDAYIIAPQNPGTAWNPQKIWQTVEWAKANYPIDTCRIYTIGMSLGGYGVLDFSAVYYDKLAAALGMCGGSTAKDVSGLNAMPLWIAHGTADKAVPFRCSQMVVDQMKQVGNTDRLIFTRIVGGSHGLLARVFYWKPAYHWLFAHKLDDPDRPVSHRDTSGMSIHGLEHVYRDLGGWKTTVTVPIFDNGQSVSFIDNGRHSSHRKTSARKRSATQRKSGTRKKAVTHKKAVSAKNKK